MTLLFLDANVPMYAGGQPHPMKEPCKAILLLVGYSPQAFFTNAEVLQELMHRYLELNFWSHGRVLFHDFNSLMRGRVEPIHARDVEDAALLADQHSGLSSRDLLHAAVMARVGADGIVSADRGFDRLPGVQRLDPLNLPSWRELVSVT